MASSQSVIMLGLPAMDTGHLHNDSTRRPAKFYARANYGRSCHTTRTARYHKTYNYYSGIGRLQVLQVAVRAHYLYETLFWLLLDPHSRQEHLKGGNKVPQVQAGWDSSVGVVASSPVGSSYRRPKNRTANAVTPYWYIFLWMTP